MYQHGSASEQRKVSDYNLLHTFETVCNYLYSHFLPLVTYHFRLHQTLAKVKLKEELRKKEAIHEEMKAAEETERRKREEEAKAQRLMASKVAKSVPDKKPLLGITVSEIDAGYIFASLYSFAINPFAFVSGLNCR